MDAGDYLEPATCKGCGGYQDDCKCKMNSMNSMIDQVVEQRKKEEAFREALWKAERAKASVLTVANKDTLTTARKELNDVCEKLLTGKGEAYAHSKLDNETGQRFKKAAAELGITPIQVVMVYASKHWASIQKWCQDGCKDDVVGDEPINGRIADLRNYLDFIYYLWNEGRHG